MVLLSFIAPRVAVIVDVPSATAVASPLALIVATDVVDDVHVTVAVISEVDPSENVPVAMNCNVNPLATDPLIGVTSIETSSALAALFGILSSSERKESPQLALKKKIIILINFNNNVLFEGQMKNKVLEIKNR